MCSFINNKQNPNEQLHFIKGRFHTHLAKYATKHLLSLSIFN